MQSLPISIIAVSFMTFMTIVFFFPTTPNLSGMTMNYTVVVLGGVLALSLMWYYLPVYGGVHWFTGPVLNIDREDRRNTAFVATAEQKKVSGEGSVEQAL